MVIWCQFVDIHIRNTKHIIDIDFNVLLQSNLNERAKKNIIKMNEKNTDIRWKIYLLSGILFLQEIGSSVCMTVQVQVWQDRISWIHFIFFLSFTWNNAIRSIRSPFSCWVVKGRNVGHAFLFVAWRNVTFELSNTSTFTFNTTSYFPPSMSTFFLDRLFYRSNARRKRINTRNNYWHDV